MEDTMKRTSTIRPIQFALVLAGLGIACGQQTKPGVQAARPSAPSQTAVPKVTKRVALIDPVLQMEAYAYKMPEGWSFEGTILPGPSCNGVPSPVYRATSPDGITQMKEEPPLDWSWGDEPPPGSRFMKTDDCLKWTQEVSAADFVNYMIGVLHVTRVKDIPVDPQVTAGFAEAVRKNNASWAAQTPPSDPFPMRISRREPAMSIVRYNLGAVPVEERLSVILTCTDASQPLLRGGWGHRHKCGAAVSRWRTRQGNMDAMSPVFFTAAASGVMNPQWNQRWLQALQADAASARAIGAASQAQTQRMHNQQMAAQEMRNQQHQEMMAVTQRGSDMVSARNAELSAAGSQMSHDWADYALDLQKRMDPNTGQISKDSSQYSYTWVNEFGERIQSNDPNYNPNGQRKGNWTLQTNIR